jgi:hypothetical protein
MAKEKQRYRAEMLHSMQHLNDRLIVQKDYKEYIEKRFIFDCLQKLNLEQLKELVNFKLTDPQTMEVNDEYTHNEREHLYFAKAIKFSADFFI